LSWTKAERLEEFCRRLSVAPPAKNTAEARKLVETTLNAVEDDYSGVPYDPYAVNATQQDGRMYPPDDKFQVLVPDHSDILCLRQRGHATYFRENGAFEIKIVKTKEVFFQKPGADGRGVWDP
jgi:hypothetical protein